MRRRDDHARRKATVVAAARAAVTEGLAPLPPRKPSVVERHQHAKNLATVDKLAARARGASARLRAAEAERDAALATIAALREELRRSEETVKMLRMLARAAPTV